MNRPLTWACFSAAFVFQPLDHPPQPWPTLDDFSLGEHLACGQSTRRFSCARLSRNRSSIMASRAKMGSFRRARCSGSRPILRSSRSGSERVSLTHSQIKCIRKCRRKGQGIVARPGVFPARHDSGNKGRITFARMICAHHAGMAIAALHAKTHQVVVLQGPFARVLRLPAMRSCTACHSCRPTIAGT